MSFFPAFLDLRGKDCLVVGGGAVALQKVRSLRRAGARVKVVAPEILPALRRMGGVSKAQRSFRPGDLAGRWLVVAATDDEKLNARISRLGAARRLWANVVDRPALCGFIVPAVARRGPVTFAVSTGGASPALAKFLARRLKKDFGPEYAALARRLKRMRPRLLKMSLAKRREFLKRILK